MDSNRKTAIITGVLFLAVLASSILSGSLSGSVDDPDYLVTVSADEFRVLMGVLFMVTLTASVVSIPIVLFPVLKRPLHLFSRRISPIWKKMMTSLILTLST